MSAEKTAAEEALIVAAMSEWSDDACDTAFNAWLDTPGDPADRGSWRAALTAADAVRKREALDRATVNTPEFMDPLEALERRVSALAEEKAEAETAKMLILRMGEVFRRLSALEAARPEPTIKPDLKVAEPERRCGTCDLWVRGNWTISAPRAEPFPNGRCTWGDTRLPAANRCDGSMNEAYGTDCPTWEARNDR